MEYVRHLREFLSLTTNDHLGKVEVRTDFLNQIWYWIKLDYENLRAVLRYTSTKKWIKYATDLI